MSRDTFAVTIWAEDGNGRKAMDARAGDRIEWKRNGQLGTVFGMLAGATASGARLSVIPDGSMRKIGIKPNICAVWRNGKRIYS